MTNMNRGLFVCVHGFPDKLHMLYASISSLFACCCNVKFKLLVSYDTSNKTALEQLGLLIKLLNASFSPHNNKIDVWFFPHHLSVAAIKMKYRDYLIHTKSPNLGSWYINSDDDVLYDYETCLKLSNAMEYGEAVGIDRFGFGFYDVVPREGTYNWTDTVFDFGDRRQLIQEHDVRDTFLFWYNLQRWKNTPPATRIGDCIAVENPNKPTAFANSYLCKFNVFEPLREEFLNWPKGVRGYDVRLHTYSEPWPFIWGACVHHIGSTTPLMNDVWKEIGYEPCRA